MLSSSTAGGIEDLAAARERAFAGEDAAQRANAEAAQLRAKLAHLEQVSKVCGVEGLELGRWEWSSGGWMQKGRGSGSRRGSTISPQHGQEQHMPSCTPHDPGWQIRQTHVALPRCSSQHMQQGIVQALCVRV